jgi:hypothetical protein
MQTTKKQNVIATSESAIQFVKDEAASFSAPNKGGDITTASNREIVDAMHRFVEANRYKTVEETDEQGNVCEREVDAFGEVVAEVLAERLDAVRVNSATAKLANAEAQLAELRAQLAALQAGK